MFAPLDLVILCFACISTIVYIFTISLLIHKRKEPPFNSRFYALFISAGVADICLGFDLYLNVSMEWGWVNWGPLYSRPYLGWVLRRMIVVYTFFSLSQYYGVLLMALNRYYCIKEMQWTKKLHYRAIILQWLVPTVAVMPLIPIKYEVYVRNISGISYFSPEPAEPTIYKISGMVFTTSQMLVGIITLFLYAKIYLHSKNIQRDFGLTDSNKGELKLALVGFVLFVLMGSQQLVLMVEVMTKESHPEDTALVEAFLEMSIVFSFISPWLLISCSKATREAMMRTVKVLVRRNNQVQVQNGV